MPAVPDSGFQTQNLILKKSAVNWERLQFRLGVCYSETSLFYKSRPKLLTTNHFVRLSKCAFRDISFDMIVYTLAEMFNSAHQQFRILTVFHAVSFLSVS